MAISQEQAKKLLEDVIFTGDGADEWVQDVWGLSSTLGESAASLVDVFHIMLSVLSEAQLEKLLRQVYEQHEDAIAQSKMWESWQDLF
ncbi:MAG: hypothetical protein QNJ47_01540 [Nostocaceae cyanobacterium]|nr:hypothetical protein [Nostocaceae cyanobacterium]